VDMGWDGMDGTTRCGRLVYTVLNLFISLSVYGVGAYVNQFAMLRRVREHDHDYNRMLSFVWLIIS
jgi:hypothetical protein